MQVELSLVEKLLNAIARGRVRGVQLTRKAVPVSETSEDLRRVLQGKIEAACSVARENTIEQLHRNYPTLRLLGRARALKNALEEVCDKLEEGHPNWRQAVERAREILSKRVGIGDDL